MVHLLTSSVLETITPTTGKPSTCPAGSLATKPMPLPSSGAMEGRRAPRLLSARLLSRLKVTPLALRISASEPQVSSLSAKATPPWTSARACCSCALCRWSWVLQRRETPSILPALALHPRGNRMFLGLLTCAGRGGPPSGAAETGSGLPQHWRSLAQTLSPHWLSHPPAPAEPPGILPPARRQKSKVIWAWTRLSVGWTPCFRTFCSESFRRSRWGLRRPLTSSRMRSPWRWMTSRVGQQ